MLFFCTPTIIWTLSFICESNKLLERERKTTRASEMPVKKNVSIRVRLNTMKFNTHTSKHTRPRRSECRPKSDETRQWTNALTAFFFYGKKSRARCFVLAKSINLSTSGHTFLYLVVCKLLFLILFFTYVVSNCLVVIVKFLKTKKYILVFVLEF